MAVPINSLSKINATLKPRRAYSQNNVPSIKTLLLHSHIVEAKGQKQENMLYCMQKMENIIQQKILDILFQDHSIDDEVALFDKTAYLFEKSAAVDLYKEYARKRKLTQMPVYLNKIQTPSLPH